MELQIAVHKKVMALQGPHEGIIFCERPRHVPQQGKRGRSCHFVLASASTVCTRIEQSVDYVKSE